MILLHCNPAEIVEWLAILCDGNDTFPIRDTYTLWIPKVRG